MSEIKIPYLKNALVSISDAIQISKAGYNIRGERKVEFSHTPRQLDLIKNNNQRSCII
jgi:hypothetical protein